jgi:hypothetical protein
MLIRIKGYIVNSRLPSNINFTNKKKEGKKKEKGLEPLLSLHLLAQSSSALTLY